MNAWHLWMPANYNLLRIILLTFHQHEMDTSSPHSIQQIQIQSQIQQPAEPHNLFPQ